MQSMYNHPGMAPHHHPAFAPQPGLPSDASFYHHGMPMPLPMPHGPPGVGVPLPMMQQVPPHRGDYMYAQSQPQMGDVPYIREGDGAGNGGGVGAGSVEYMGDKTWNGAPGGGSGGAMLLEEEQLCAILRRIIPVGKHNAAPSSDGKFLRSINALLAPQSWEADYRHMYSLEQLLQRHPEYFGQTQSGFFYQHDKRDI